MSDFTDTEDDLCEECEIDLVGEDTDCICCGDPIFFCRRCLPVRNRVWLGLKQFVFCDYCGTTFDERMEEIFDDQFYQVLFNNTGIDKEEIIKSFRSVQDRFFTKEKQFKRIDEMIELLQAKIKDLEEEKRAVQSILDRR